MFHHRDSIVRLYPCLCECGAHKQDGNDTNQDDDNITNTTTINNSLFRKDYFLHRINFCSMNNGIGHKNNNERYNDLN